MRSSILLLVSATVVAAQKTPIEPRLIDAPNARLPIALGTVGAVRQLPDGRLLVNDTQRRQLLIIDRALSATTVIADSAAGKQTSYGAKAGGLISYRADSTLFVDPDGLSMFVIDPAGRIARVASVPRSQDAAALASNNAGIDSRGRLVYRGLTRVKQVVNGGLTLAQFPDSIDVDRIDLATRRVDTAGYFRVSKTNMTITQTEHGMSVGAEVNPVQTVDDWAVLADGSIAIVRGQDYHVDLIGADASVKSAAKIPFNWRPLTDEEKLVVLDSAKRQIDRMFSGAGPDQAAMMAMHGDGAAIPIAGGHGAPTAAPNSPPPVKLVPASALPDFWPVFNQGGVKPDADGNLWVRTSAIRPGAIGGPIYDVIDRAGSLADRVQIPPGRQIVGFGKGGTVYMAARESNGTFLERTVAARADSSKFIGDWEGSFRSDHASGSMALTVARDSAWKVSIELVMGSQVVPSRVRDFRIDGHDAFFTIEAMDMACKSAATLDGDALNGEMDCGHAKLGFSLKKRAK